MAAKKMIKMRKGTELGFLLADATRVLKAATKHWRLLVKFGYTDGDRKKLEELISQVQALLTNRSAPPISLEAPRKALQDELRGLRLSARLFCDYPGHKDAAARQALKLGMVFPHRDGLLKSYVSGLSEVIAKYSPQLAQRGFPAARQTALKGVTTNFLDAIAHRGELIGEAHAARQSTDALVESLREMISYFREGGHGALYGQPASADFDRLQTKKPAPKKVAAVKRDARAAAAKAKAEAAALAKAAAAAAKAAAASKSAP